MDCERGSESSEIPDDVVVDTSELSGEQMRNIPLSRNKKQPPKVIPWNRGSQDKGEELAPSPFAEPKNIMQ